MVEYFLWTRALGNARAVQEVYEIKSKTASFECFTSCTGGPESSHSMEFGANDPPDTKNVFLGSCVCVKMQIKLL